MGESTEYTNHGRMSGLAEREPARAGKQQDGGGRLSKVNGSRYFPDKAVKTPSECTY